MLDVGLRAPNERRVRLDAKRVHIIKGLTCPVPVFAVADIHRHEPLLVAGSMFDASRRAVSCVSSSIAVSCKPTELAIWISTVLDHSFRMAEQPLLFETMVFGPSDALMDLASVVVALRLIGRGGDAAPGGRGTRQVEVETGEMTK